MRGSWTILTPFDRYSGSVWFPGPSGMTEEEAEDESSEPSVDRSTASNEEASVGSVIAEIRSALPRARVLVVDDGSTDRTADVARQLVPSSLAFLITSG